MFRWHTALPCPGMIVRGESSTEKRAGKVLKSRKGKQPMSLASKITTSATMLAREMAGSSSASNFSELLSNASSMGNKASNGRSVDSSRWMEELPIRSTSLYGPPGSSHASFRSSPMEELPNPEFENFINSSASLLRILPDQDEAYHRSSMTKVTSSGMLDQFSTLSSDTHYMDFEQFDSGSEFHQAAASSEAIDVLDRATYTRAHTHLSTTEPEQLDRLALARLRLIVGHLAQTSSSGLQFYDPTQNVLEQEAEATIHASQTLFHLSNEAAQDIMREAQSSAQNTRSDAYIQSPMQNTYRQALGHHGSTLAQEHEEDCTTSDFHCPWIRCHQRFRNPSELQRHSDTHTEYACPHEDCPVLCQSRTAWADHAVEPHHDLLEGTFRTLSNSEAEAVAVTAE